LKSLRFTYRTTGSPSASSDDCEVDIGRQTRNTWTHAIACFLMIIGSAILLELQRAQILQIDETPVDYLSPGHGSAKQG
jgi:hypothetical protein